MQQAPLQQGFGAPQQQQGFGAPQQQQGFGAPQQQQQGFGAPQQPGFGAPQQQQGFGAPQQPGFGAPQQQPGFGAPLQQPGFGGSMTTDFGGDLDDDLKPKGKGMVVGILLAVVAALGIGGYLFLADGDADKGPSTEETGPAKVIKAGEIPPDTQGPKGAKGAGVDSIEGSKFKEGTRPSGGGSRPSGGSNNSGSKAKKKKTDEKTKIIETDDPLAGIDGS